jgi:hypothetical protein
MAIRTLTVLKVFRNNGKAYINWSNGEQEEFSSLAEAKAFAASLTDDIAFVKKLALARYFFVDPNATNPSLIEGKTITVTNESNTMVTVG